MPRPENETAAQNQLILDVETILSWFAHDFNAQANDPTINLNQLGQARNKLTYYCFELAKICGHLQHQHKCQHTKRKILFNKTALEYSKAESVARAQMLATTEHATEYEKESQLEGQAQNAAILLRACQQAISCIIQEISILKLELSHPNPMSA